MDMINFAPVLPDPVKYCTVHTAHSIKRALAENMEPAGYGSNSFGGVDMPLLKYSIPLNAFYSLIMNEKKEMGNELELWREFQQGSMAAYAELYKAYSSILYSYGMKFTSDITLVEDSIHDLFCTLWTSRERLSQPPSVKNYLFKSFRNCLYKKINKASFFVNEEQVMDFHFELAFDDKLVQNENQQQAKKQIEKALEKLTTRQREIIYYRFYQDLEFDEIADIMNMQVRATYKLTARAMDTLRTLIPGRIGISLLLLSQLV